MPRVLPDTTVPGHKTWLQIVREAEKLIDDDEYLQYRSSKGFWIKTRKLPAEVLGRIYAQYCTLMNKLYDSYLNSDQLQRGYCMLEIISIFMKRLYELRKELIQMFVTDYFYVDGALEQLKMIPPDIEILYPYHLAKELRPDSMESLLQRMWSDAARRERRKARPKKIKKPPSPPPGQAFQDEDAMGFGTPGPEQPPPVDVVEEESEESLSPEPSVHTIIPPAFLHINIIQKHERFRQYYMTNFRAANLDRRRFRVVAIEPPPEELSEAAARIIQLVFREYMKIKRKHIRDHKRDIVMGYDKDYFEKTKSFQEANEKMYEWKRQRRLKMQKVYLNQMEKENMRLIMFRKDDQMDDITDHIREWFMEWYYGYGFFPNYPYELEGGTLLLLRGEYPSIEEQVIDDEKYLAATKGKTKDQLKQEKQQAAQDALYKKEQLEEQQKKLAEQLFKLRCSPPDDPGYEVKTSEYMGDMRLALQDYRACWSIYDSFPPEKHQDVVYGHIQHILTEDLMCQLHKECRFYVDQLMRLELKLFVKAHQLMYKRVGWKYPKLRGRPRPKIKVPKPRVFDIDDKMMKGFENIFDLKLVSRPTTRIKDIIGDSNYAAYNLHIEDPNPKFPPPGYGDLRQRLIMSCGLGAGVERGAKRNKAVMLVGVPRNGKSFLVDAIAGEMDAVKIDISPQVFSRVVHKLGPTLNQVFQAARAFQPTIIFFKDIEKVFAKKVPHEDKVLKAKRMKNPLKKCIKAMAAEDKIIFIATCSRPFTAREGPMAALFNEIVLVPAPDYGTISQYLKTRFLSIRSIPRGFGVQPLAHCFYGYGFGIIIETFNKVMNEERIVRLNVNRLDLMEFREHLIDVEPATRQELQAYSNFCIKHSPLRKIAEEYKQINDARAYAYKKFEEIERKKEEQKQKA